MVRTDRQRYKEYTHNCMTQSDKAMMIVYSTCRYNNLIDIERILREANNCCRLQAAGLKDKYTVIIMHTHTHTQVRTLP